MSERIEVGINILILFGLAQLVMLTVLCFMVLGIYYWIKDEVGIKKNIDGGYQAKEPPIEE